MSQESTLIVVVGLVLSLGLMASAIVVVRSLRKQSKDQEGMLAQIGNDQRQLARTLQPLTRPGPALDCVITEMTFAESFDPDRFAIICQSSTKQSIEKQLGAMIGDGARIAVNSIRLGKSTASITFQLSKKGQMLLDAGSAEIVRHASGQLPMIRDVKTKKIIEIFKGAPKAKTLSRLTAMSTAVIGGAHLISGADIAKRLNVIDKKIDLLLAYRRIDQLAKLERIYTAARELCSSPLNHQKNWELWRLRGELRELRSAWRRELQQQLNRIEDPNAAPWFTKMFTGQQSLDQSVHQQITESQLHLGMIDYSLRLEHVLAVVSGTINEFEQTLSGELGELEGVARLLKDKSGYISGKHPEWDVTPTIEGMNSIVKEYRSLLPDHAASNRLGHSAEPNITNG